MNARRTLVAALAVVAATSGVSSAAPGDSPPRQVSDPCGDAETSVRSGESSVVMEDDAPQRDLSGAGVRVTWSGDTAEALVVDLDTCGAASSAAEYLFQADLGDDCVLSVEYVPRRLRENVLEPEVRVVETCFSENTDPVTSQVQSTTVREVSRTALDAQTAAFDGSTLRITVPVAALPAVTSARLADGAVWPRTAAAARDTEVGTFAFAFGSFFNPKAAANVRYDIAFGDGYVVGQDRP